MRATLVTCERWLTSYSRAGWCGRAVPSPTREGCVSLDELGQMLAREWQEQRRQEAERERWVRVVRGAQRRAGPRGGPRLALARLLFGLAVRLDAQVAFDDSPFLYT